MSSRICIVAVWFRLTRRAPVLLSKPNIKVVSIIKALEGMQNLEGGDELATKISVAEMTDGDD